MKESRYNIWTEWRDAFYVFNGVSGSLLRVPSEHRAALQAYLDGVPGAACRPELLVSMARGRMLLQDEADELAFLARRYRTATQAGAAFSFTLLPSMGCNFDCLYCFEAKRPALMSKEVQRAVVDALEARLPGSAEFEALWFGGEPLLAKEAIYSLSDAMIERCERHGVAYEARLITNGYLLDRETCLRLRDHRIEYVQVTLDGPPDVHDRMRPLAGGGPNFWRIVENLHHAADILDIHIRVNIGSENADRVEELMQILTREGFAGRLSVYPAYLQGVDIGVPCPSAAYQSRCFSPKEFTPVRVRVKELAVRYGLNSWKLPLPIHSPCPGVNSRSLVVGPNGELYKCWHTLGNEREIIGDIWHHEQPNDTAEKWIKYDPLVDPECRDCLSLPLCMGGCAHYAMSTESRPNRCKAFEDVYRRQILQCIEAEAASHAGNTQ